jgi:glycerol-3-phosphate dehydrogenase (NAD(P)+)
VPSSTDQAPIAVLGAGGWGFAISRLLSDEGKTVRLWEFDPKAADAILRTRTIPDKLPDIELPQSVKVTNDIAEAIQDAGTIVFVTPSSAIRPTAKSLRGKVAPGCLILSLAKGTDIETGERMTEIIESELGFGPVVALMGPSHAEEVARGIPTAVVAACTDLSAAERAQEVFSTPMFRVYTSTDPIGVEIGASMKNIVAIAAGIVDGLGFSSADNLKGALITRGLAEIARLGVRMGADPETFSGLSGVGDLITTCLSKHSRNRYVGEQIGRGKSLDDILASMTMVAEGVNTTKAAVNLAKRYEVDMPIAQAVWEVLFNGRLPGEALAELMSRTPKPEIRR